MSRKNTVTQDARMIYAHPIKSTEYMHRLAVLKQYCIYLNAISLHSFVNQCFDGCVNDIIYENSPDGDDIEKIMELCGV